MSENNREPALVPGRTAWRIQRRTLPDGGPQFLVLACAVVRVLPGARVEVAINPWASDLVLPQADVFADQEAALAEARRRSAEAESEQ